MAHQFAGVLFLQFRLSQNLMEPLDAEFMPLGIGRVYIIDAAVCGNFIGQGIAVGTVLENMQFVVDAELAVLLGDGQCSVGCQQILGSGCDKYRRGILISSCRYSSLLLEVSCQNSWPTFSSGGHGSDGAFDPGDVSSFR